MMDDPGQVKDISKKHPDIAARLTKAANQFRQSAIKNIPPRPFTVGHRGSVVTHLPARDGISHGSIKRSNRFPNDSFFLNWTSTDDSITWDIEVLTPGRYEAQLHYTCRKEDVGAKMQLVFENHKTECTITEAHDPPLVGSQQDRFDRAESYVKDFMSTSMGVLEMPAKRGQLTLKAVEIPGERAVDVRYVVFTRITD